MKRLALLGSAFVLASAVTASAATVSNVFDDHFTETSFDTDNNLVYWDAPGLADTCGETAITCDNIANISLLTRQSFILEAGATYNLSAYFKRSEIAALVTVAIGNFSNYGRISVLADSTVSTGDFFVADEVEAWISLSVDNYGIIDYDPLGEPIMGESPLISRLDRVVLSKISADLPPSVPVPASAPLLLAGLGAMGALRLRKRKS